MNLQEDICKNYKRVTSILSPFTDFSNIDPKVLANAADRGTRVHKFCELYLKNLLIEPVTYDCKPYFDSFVQWSDSVLEKVIHTEERYFCEALKITGQVDLVVKLKGDDHPMIIDIKTPQTDQKAWQLQTAAYMYLYNVNQLKNGNGKAITRRGCLMLHKNGDPAKFKEYTNNERDTRLFFNAVELHDFFNGRKI